MRWCSEGEKLSDGSIDVGKQHKPVKTRPLSARLSSFLSDWTSAQQLCTLRCTSFLLFLSALSRVSPTRRSIRPLRTPGAGDCGSTVYVRTESVVKW